MDEQCPAQWLESALACRAKMGFNLFVRVCEMGGICPHI